MTKSAVIAVVEHDTGLRELLNEALTAVGYQTLVCSESRGAQDLIRREQPNLIVLNSWLEASLDGCRLLEQLAYEPTTSSIPVVVLGEDGHQADVANVIRELAASTLPMPFDVQQLLDLIQALLISPPDINEPRTSSGADRTVASGARRVPMLTEASLHDAHRRRRRRSRLGAIVVVGNGHRHPTFQEPGPVRRR